MSERQDHRTPDQPVDPRLDSLLRRTLGQGRLSASQRARHYDELNLDPGLSTGAGDQLTALPTVSGTPHSISFDTAEIEAGGRSGRQLLELVAMVVALVLGVGFMLTLLWEDRDGPAAQPFVTPEPFATQTAPALYSTPTTAPAPPPFATAPERLYAVSHALSDSRDAVLTAGRITAIDPATGEQVWSRHLGTQVDAVLSRDGLMLYATRSHGDGQPAELLAIDAISGQEVWRSQVSVRSWTHGTGSSGMVLSPDGSLLYLLGCKPGTGPCDTTNEMQLATFATTDGAWQRTRELDGCFGTPYLAPDGGTLYLLCDGRAGARVVDLATGESETLLLGGPLVGSAASPDGRWLYVIFNDDGVYQAAVIDMVSRELVIEMASVALVGSQPDSFLDLVTISPDGSRLFIGILSAYNDNTPLANDVFVTDTETWQSVGRMTAEPPITGRTLAPAVDGRSIFATAVDIEYEPSIWTRSRISRFSMGEAPRTVTVLEHQQVLRLLIWTGPAVDTDAPGSLDGALRGAESTPQLAVTDAATPMVQPEPCPVTPYSAGAPSDPRHAVVSEHWYGNATGGMWAGLSRAHDGEWNAAYVEVLWWLDDPSPLSVTIRRVDDGSEPLTAFVLSDHDPFRALSSVLTFPSAGCWEVMATTDTSELRFTVNVSHVVRGYGRDDYSALLLNTEAERAALLETPDPASCASTEWTGPDYRTGYSYRYPWYLDGDGLYLGAGHGVLFTGPNDLVWLSGAVRPEQQLQGPGTIAATLLDETGEVVTTHDLHVEVRQQVGNGWAAESGIRHAWVTTVAFPEAGCWRVQAAVGEHTLEAVVYVRALP